jgi:hypothetical protein
MQSSSRDMHCYCNEKDERGGTWGSIEKEFYPCKALARIADTNQHRQTLI